MNPKVDFYFNKAAKWQQEVEKLRMIVLDCSLNEDLKWGCPCYTIKESNIVLIHVFKEYCALLFFKGALLKDTKGILIQQTKNVQAARQIRFTNVREIVKLEPVIKAYIYEAIEGEMSIVGWEDKGMVRKEMENKIIKVLQPKMERSDARIKAKELVELIARNKHA